MSFPPGTEMFQFPGFAPAPYVFRCGYPLPGGLPHSDVHGSTPARGSPWLFAACHVLRRLLVPRHPPNALILLGRPGTPRRARPLPCTETIPRRRRRSRGPAAGWLPEKSCFRTRPDSRRRRLAVPRKSVSVPERSPPGLGGAALAGRIPGQTPGRAAGRGHPSGRPCRARPGTHQNLIHSDKERLRQPLGAGGNAARAAARGAVPGRAAAPASEFRDTGGGRRRVPRRAGLETIGIEPMTPCLQSRCSPS